MKKINREILQDAKALLRRQLGRLSKDAIERLVRELDERGHLEKIKQESYLHGKHKGQDEGFRDGRASAGAGPQYYREMGN